MKCEICNENIISSVCYIWRHNEKILKVCNKCKLTQVNQVMKYLENNLQYEEFIKGAYEFSPGKDITIFATGSELEIAKEVSDILDDLSIQIISVPILDKLDNETLNLLNPNSEIFTIELGRSVGWDSYIKNIKKSFSINSFGKSAPIEDLINEFNFSAEKIANEIKYLIN